MVKIDGLIFCISIQVFFVLSPNSFRFLKNIFLTPHVIYDYCVTFSKGI